MEKYIVSKKYLEDVINLCSRALVGKVMKRFELFTDRKALKKVIKELIYENYRSFKALIESYNFGVEFKDKDRDK